MKKTLLSTFLFILFIVSVGLIYLSFFGYETSKFNNLIKSEIKKNNKDFKLEFKKLSFLLDIKKLTLYIRFIDPEIDYNNTSIPLNSLRTDIDLEILIKKKIGIKRILASTNYLDVKKINSLLKNTNYNNLALKKIKEGSLKIKKLELYFDENLNIKNNYKINGDIKDIKINFSDEYILKDLKTNFEYEINKLVLKNSSYTFITNPDKSNEFFNGNLEIIKKNKKFNISFNSQTRQIPDFFVISGMNYSFSASDITTINGYIVFKNKNDISIKELKIEDKNNLLSISNLILDVNNNLLSFNKIKIKTSINNKVNNDFVILKNNKKISVKGAVFDAKNLLKTFSQDSKKNNFLTNISKDIEIELDKILKGLNFPMESFRLVGKINKGEFIKISAKSDFANNKHLDISLKRDKGSDKKTLEVYSDIATPLLNDYDFFQGLDGGKLLYESKFDKSGSYNTLTINDFKLNDAPALAKLLTLADLKGLTDSLKGEGISFDTLSIKFETDENTMTISEIFMIGPSISVLIDGYVEKKSGLTSLRGTLVPAKTLNSLVSKIPVVGDILVGDKVGEGVFGLSFKIKGKPDNLKTSVNPVKTLAPRFITRAVEAAKKRKIKQQSP